MTDTVQVGTNYIVKTPGNLGGRARIDGRRIGVSDIVLAHFHYDETLEEIATNYNLSLAQIHAALAYYYDHREEIDSYLTEIDNYVAENWPTQEEMAEEKERLLAKMKERDPERYARIMRQKQQPD
jgi:uncharacterized protein (DUF433 family)